MNSSAFDPSLQNQSVDGKIVAALERVSQAFRVLLWNESKEFALSPIQVQALVFLRYHSPDKRKVTYLADELNVTKATVSDTVKTLEQKGLIQKEHETHDSRSYVIHLTDKGKEVAEQTALFSREIQAPVDRMPPHDKENLLLSLMDIIRHLNRSGVITVQRMCFSCAHYRPNHLGANHFCQLLNAPLDNGGLRVDCPEHRPA